MQSYRKFIFVIFACCFALLFIGGSHHLIGHEDTVGHEDRVIRVAEAVIDTAASQVPHAGQTRSERPAGMLMYSTPSSSLPAHLATDSNGNILRGKLSYMKLLYNVFSLSDGFA